MTPSDDKIDSKLIIIFMITIRQDINLSVRSHSRNRDKIETIRIALSLSVRKKSTDYKNLFNAFVVYDSLIKLHTIATCLYMCHEWQKPVCFINSLNPLPPDRQYFDDASTKDMLVNFFRTLFLFVCSIKCTAGEASARRQKLHRQAELCCRQIEKVCRRSKQAQSNCLHRLRSRVKGLEQIRRE